MATVKPVYCLNCGAQVRKTGYCSACYMPVDVVKKAYNTSDYYYNMAYDKAVARDLSGAVESLYMSLRYNKRNIMSRNLLGLIYYEMGEIVMAISHWVMSVNYQDKGNLAAKYLKEVKRDGAKLEESDDIAKKFNTALAYAENHDYDLALIQLRQVLADNYHFVKGYLLYALICMKQDNYEKARQVIKRVLIIDRANPIAIHYLREMGDSNENIIKFRQENIGRNHESDEEYLEEIASSLLQEEDILKSAKKKAYKKSRRSEANVKGSIKEVHFIRYSGMYVLIGIVFGVLLFNFLIAPSRDKDTESKNKELVKSYSEELANKNTQIESLNAEIETLNGKIERLKQEAQAIEDMKLPDYSGINHGLSADDIKEMLKNE